MAQRRQTAEVSVVPTSYGTREDVVTIPTRYDYTTTDVVAVGDLVLRGITATNITTGTSSQLHLGILYSGESDWRNELISPTLRGGQVATWDSLLGLRLSSGDIIQAWASVTGVIDITLELEEEEL